MFASALLQGPARRRWPRAGGRRVRRGSSLTLAFVAWFIGLTPNPGALGELSVLASHLSVSTVRR